MGVPVSSHPRQPWPLREPGEPAALQATPQSQPDEPGPHRPPGTCPPTPGTSRAATTPELSAHLAYLARAFKAPTIAAAWAELADVARDQGWSHEECLAAVLARQVNDREANGTQLRIAGTHFPAVKTLEDFNLDHQPSLRRDVVAHLATTAFVPTAGIVILLGPPGVGKTHLAIARGYKAVQAGHPVLFDTAIGWIARLTAARREGRLPAELKRLRRYRVLIVDEVGYIPFDAEAANLFFQLVAARYEQGSMLVTSNVPFGRWR